MRLLTFIIFSLFFAEQINAQCNLTSSVLFELPPTSCGANDGFVQVQANNGTGPITYTWNTSPQQTGDQLISATAGMYIVTITDSVGCSISDTVLLSDPASFNISVLTATQPSCFGGSNGSLQVSTGIISSTYTWNNDPALTNPSLSNITAGIYLITGVDAGCAVNQLVTLSQPAEIVANVNIINQVLCKDQSNGAAFATATGGTGTLDFNWTPSGLINDSISGLAAGNYQLIVTDDNSCADNVNFTISEPTDSLIIDSILVTDAACFGLANGQLESFVSGGTTPYAYSWAGSSSDSSIAANLNAGNYTFFATDFNGCADTLSAGINQPNALAITLTPQKSTICLGSSTVINSNVTGGTQPYSYLWNTTAISDSITVSPAVNTPFTLFITDSKNCQLNSTTNITISPSPTISLINSDTICTGASKTINASGTTTYSWFPSQGLNTTTGGTVIANPSANTQYYVIGTNANGCTKLDSVQIIIDNTTTAQFTVLPAAPGTGDTVNFTNTSTGTGLTYTWDFNDGTSLLTDTNPTHTFAFEGEYEVVLTTYNNHVCKDTFALKVIVEDTYSFELPNIFTPNGDGKNDAFRFIKAKGIETLHCEIYNRYGIREYSFDGPLGQWEGFNQSGQTCVAGVYFYVITLTANTGEKKEFSGNITLIR